MRATPTSALALLWTALASGPAAAAYATYTDRPSFLAAAGTVATETFDELSSPTPFPRLATIGGVDYAAPSGFQAVAFGPSFPASSPPNVLNPVAIGPVALYFGNGTVRAFGFTLAAPSPVTPSMPADFSVAVYEAGVETPLLSESYPASAANYLGFVEAAGSPGISEVLIAPVADAGGTTFNFALDDVSHGAITPGSSPVVLPFSVPGPPSVAMLGLGVAGVGIAGRRRRRACRARP